MTESLISFPANLEMVNNETDVTGRQPGSWCAHYGNGRNNCGFPKKPTILDVPAQSLRAREAEWELGTFATDKYRSASRNHYAA